MMAVRIWNLIIFFRVMQHNNFIKHHFRLCFCKLNVRCRLVNAFFCRFKGNLVKHLKLKVETFRTRAGYNDGPPKLRLLLLSSKLLLRTVGQFLFPFLFSGELRLVQRARSYLSFLRIECFMEQYLEL